MFLPHVATVDDAVWQTKTHHETTRSCLLSVEHSSVFNTNVHIIIADFLPVWKDIIIVVLRRVVSMRS